MISKSADVTKNANALGLLTTVQATEMLNNLNKRANCAQT